MQKEGAWVVRIQKAEAMQMGQCVGHVQNDSKAVYMIFSVHMGYVRRASCDCIKQKSWHILKRPVPRWTTEPSCLLSPTLHT